MPAQPAPAGRGDDALFTAIAEDLRARSCSIRHGALPEALAADLRAEVATLPGEAFHSAGVGRAGEHRRNRFVRSDAICWIRGASPAAAAWVGWTGRLREALNRQLLLGLFSFESHYACYGPGDFYRRHVDAFRGEANRVLSLVAYLNPGWGPADGGELVLYRDAADRSGTRVTPLHGTLVTFLSEEIPHEVLPAARPRYSIAGWYRVNGSSGGRVDPPC